jgi:hypothetical protein
MPYGEPFTSEWRRRHALMGDRTLASLDRVEGVDVRHMAAAGVVAAAHYAAANARAKPPTCTCREAGTGPRDPHCPIHRGEAHHG